MKKLLKLLVLAYLFGGNTLSAQNSNDITVFVEQKIEGDTLRLSMAGINIQQISSF